jgi:hypothetical protein
VVLAPNSVFADIVAIALVLAVFWQMRAQLRYLDAVDARRGTGLGLDREAELAVRNPLRAFVAIPRRTAARSQLTHQRQEDPELEALRRQYFLRRNVWLVASILGVIGLAVVLGVASR